MASKKPLTRRGKAEKRGAIRVFLVDDHPTVRAGLRAYLAPHSILVVGEASNDQEALRRVKKAAPDIIILDVSLPSIDGGQLAILLRKLVPKVKIIAFSMHSSEEYVVKMARCGVRGYVMKDKPTEQLLEAIKRVFQGGLYFPANMTDALLGSRHNPVSTKTTTSVLTAREVAVLSHLAEGLANKEVAYRLGISVRTVETHREHLSHKLNILTVAGLTKYAIQHGLTSLKLSI